MEVNVYFNTESKQRLTLRREGRGSKNTTKSAYVIYEWSLNNDCKKMQEWGAFFSESVIIVVSN